MPRRCRDETGGRTRWTRKDNLDVVRCFVRATRHHHRPRGYGKRMLEEWIQLRPDRVVSAVQLTGQLRFIRKGGKVSELEELELRRQIEAEDPLGDASDTVEAFGIGIETDGNQGRDGSDDPGELIACSTEVLSMPAVASASAQSMPQASVNLSRVGALAAASGSDGDEYTPLVLSGGCSGASGGACSLDLDRNVAPRSVLDGGVPVSSSDTGTQDSDGTMPSTSDHDDNADQQLTDEFLSLYADARHIPLESRKRIHPPYNIPNKRLHSVTAKVNKVIGAALPSLSTDLQEDPITTLNHVVFAGATLVLNRIASKPPTDRRHGAAQSGTPPWEKRLQGKVKSLRADISRLTSFIRSDNPRLYKTYQLTTLQDAQHLLEVRKMELLAISARLRRYREQDRRRRDNHLFSTNERDFYRRLEESETPRPCVTEHPSTEDTEDFWAGIFTCDGAFREPEWLEQLRVVNNHIEPQENAAVSIELLRSAIAGMANWKAPGRDGIHLLWWKKFTSTHPLLVTAFQSVLDGGLELPCWFSYGITTLLYKKGSQQDPANYRPITCLPTIAKVLSAIITRIMRDHISANDILSDAQTGCTPNRGGCCDQLLLDGMILQEVREKHRNLAVGWLDFRKAFDSVAHGWLVEVLRLYKFSPVIISYFQHVTSQWRTQLKLMAPDGASSLSRPIRIAKGIFQGDSASPLLFCLAINPISQELQRSGLGYKCGSGLNRLVVSHLLYMDDMKVFAPSSSTLASLINRVEIMAEDIGLKLNPAKCAVLELQRGRASDGMSVDTLRGSIIDDLGDREYKYLGIPEGAVLASSATKSAVRDEFRRRVVLLLGTSLNAINLVKGINTYAIPVVLYSLVVLGWTAAEIAALDRMVRVLLTRHKMHHPKSSTIRLYLPRDMGGRGLLSVEQMLRRSLVRIGQYLISRPDVPLLAMLRQYHDDRPPSKSITKRATAILAELGLSLESASRDAVAQAMHRMAAQELSARPLQGRYWQRLEESGADVPLSLAWLKSSTLQPGMEGFIIAVQEQMVATRNFAANVASSGATLSPMCRMCESAVETVDHILSSCPVLATTQYIARHNRVVRLVHWALCRRYDMPNTSISPRHHAIGAARTSEKVTILWETPIPTDRSVKSNRPDLVVRCKTGEV